VLVVRIDIGFGRIFTFELRTTRTLFAFPFVAGTFPPAEKLDVATGTPTTFVDETGWTTTLGNIVESNSGTSTEETDSGDESSVLTEISSQSKECSESHSSAVISVISCVFTSLYKHTLQTVKAN